jgi:2-oxo-4-hydroxy-4-carboxy--5-ureidoimidazoline (OHCU) decarboxylase
MLPRIDLLNVASEIEFVAAIHLLFEPAPPLVKQLLLHRPFSSYSQLIDVSEQCIATMSEETQILVVNAHPRIGAPMQSLSVLSKKEQGSDVPPPSVLQRLEHLNQEYEETFGFKFVVFVNGRSRADIVTVLEERMMNTRGEELQTGLKDMILIARDRLSKLNK